MAKSITITSSDVDFKEIARENPDLEEIIIDIPTESIDESINMEGVESVKNLKHISIGKNAYVDNFDVIYGCKNLENLEVFGQLHLRELDLKQFPKIKKVSTRGSGFEIIKGLGTKTPSFDSDFNFTNCVYLKEIEGLSDFSNKMIDDQRIMDPILNVDDVFYQKFMSKKENEELEQKFLDETQLKNGRNSISINVEYTNDDEFDENKSDKARMNRGTPLQMKTQRKYLDYIIKEQCHIQDSDSDWVKIKKAYDWLTETMHYAYGMLEFENCDCRGPGRYYSAETFGEKGYDHYFIGSTYYSLLQRYDILPGLTGTGYRYNIAGQREIVLDDEGNPHSEFVDRPRIKLAVCEGIANTFVQMLSHMGIESHFASCKWGNEQSGHAVVGAQIDGLYYYFDPTYDLGRRCYFGFGVSRRTLAENYRRAGLRDMVWRSNEERYLEGSRDIRDYLMQNDMLLRWDVGSDGRIARRRTLLTDIFNRSVLGYRIQNSRLVQNISPRIRSLTNAFERNVVGRNIVHAKHVLDYYSGTMEHRTRLIMRRATIGVFVALYRLHMGITQGLRTLFGYRAAVNNEVENAAGEYMLNKSVQERNFKKDIMGLAVKKAKDKKEKEREEEKKKTRTGRVNNVMTKKGENIKTL